MQYGALALYTCWLVRQRCQPHSCHCDCVCLIIYQSLCCEMNAGQTRGGLALQSLCSEWLSWTRKTMCVYNIIFIIYMLLLEAPLLSLISILLSHFFIFFLLLIDSNWNNPLTPTLSSSTTGSFTPIFSHSLPLSSRWLGANAELPYGRDTCDVL